MENKSQYSKRFWINFFQMLIIFVVVWFFVGSTWNTDSEYKEDNPYLISYIILSTCSVLYSIGKIAQKYARYEKINEAVKKEKISLQEFNKKYKAVLDIYKD